MSRLPNVFTCLHILAKQNNYDVIKWRDLLVSAYRKSNEKHSLKDTCSLYYALARGYKNDIIASLKIDLKDSDGCSGKYSQGAQLHIGINDIVDAYMNELSQFINYMNAKQLSMVTHSLAVLKRLNSTLGNNITSRIDSTKLRIPCRSLATMALAMTKSGTVSTDYVERMLVLRLDELSRTSHLDLVNICEALSLAGSFSNEKLCELLGERIHYHAATMNPEDTIICLNFLSKLEFQNEKANKAILRRISNTLEHFDNPLLLAVVKSFNRLKSQITRDFCDLRLVPHYFECLVKLYEDNVKKSLLFLIYTMKCGSKPPPSVLHSIMPNIKTTDEWCCVFNILYMYEINKNELLGGNFNRIVQPETNGDISELWSTAFKRFADYVSNNLVTAKQCANIVHWSAKSGRWNHELFDKLMVQISPDVANEPISDVVNLLYNLQHTSINTEQIVEEIEKRLNELDMVLLVKFLAAQFASGKRPPSQCLARLYEASNLEPPQGKEQNEWQIPFDLNGNQTARFNWWNDDLSSVPLNLLLHLLDSIASFANKREAKKVSESLNLSDGDNVKEIKQKLVTLLQSTINC